MSLLYTNRIIPVTATATSAQADYAAANALTQALRVTWRSANTAQSDIVIDLGVAVTLRGLGISEINAGSVVIASSPDNVTYTDRATLAFTADRFARRRACAALNTSARYWRIRIAAGTPLDGAAWWQIGSIYLWGASTEIVAPQYGFAVRTAHNESRETLANGRTAVASLGTRHDVMTGKFGVTNALVIGDLLAAMRTGAVWLDLQLPTRAWMTWPIIANATDDEESITQSIEHSEIKLDAREVVA
jgi:hypothetical protein